MSSQSSTLARLWTALRSRAGVAAVVVFAWSLVATTALAAPPGFVERQLNGNRWLYPEAASTEVRELQATASTAWQHVTSDLGIDVPSNLTIRVGRSPEEMQSLAGDVGRLPEYASGVALPERGLIFLSITAPETWQLVDIHQVLIHEMSHVALHRAVAGQPLPRWLVEGLAIEHAKERSLERVRTLWEGTLSGQLMSLADLSRGFPGRHHAVNLAYAQSADFVRFLKRPPHGSLRLSRVLQDVARGERFDESVREHYRATLGVLEQEWRQELEHRYRQWPLLLSGLTGLWFLLSLLLIAAYVRARRRHRMTLERWAMEEAAIDQTEQAERDGSDSLSATATTSTVSTGPHAPTAHDELDVPRLHQTTSGIPTIEYRGENHTLH